MTHSKRCKDCSKWTHQGFAGIRHFPESLKSWKRSQKENPINEDPGEQQQRIKGWGWGSHEDGLAAAFHLKGQAGLSGWDTPSVTLQGSQWQEDLGMRVKASAQQREAARAWQPKWGLGAGPAGTTPLKLSATCTAWPRYWWPREDPGRPHRMPRPLTSASRANGCEGFSLRCRLQSAVGGAPGAARCRVRL